MNDVTIRLETEKDYRAVEELTREAFWNVYKPGADEHYYVHMMRSHPDFIPELAFVLEKAKKIVDEIYPYLDSIGLTGLGETFLYPHLTEIASYIKSKKNSIVVSLSTNANLPGFVEKVKRVLPYIDTIQVSIDGIGDVYEQIRVDAKFCDMVENIRSILPLTRQYNVDLMFNLVITKENYHQMGKLIKFADELGVSYLNFNYLNLASVTEIDVDYYKFYYSEEFEQALAEAYKEVKCHKNRARNAKNVPFLRVHTA